MPVFIIVLGVIVGIAALNDTITSKDNQPGLWSLLSGDLFPSGQNPGFLEWAAAVLAIAALAKMVDLPEAGRALIALVIISYLLSNKGASIPQQLLSAIGSSSGGSGPSAG